MEEEKKPKKKIGLIISLSLVLIIVIAIISAIIWYTNSIKAVSDNPNEEKFMVEIPKDTSISGIGDILKKNGLIKDDFAYKVFCKLYGFDNVMAGKYELSKSMSLTEIADTLEKGPDLKKYEINITFKEGTCIRKMATLLEEKTNIKADDFIAKMKDREYIKTLIPNYWFLEGLPVDDEQIYYPLEGYLFPDTYTFSGKDVSIETVVEKMLTLMGQKLEPYKDQIKQSEFKSLHSIITLASIVELESTNGNVVGMEISSRAGVTSVFYNRLKSGMSLGSDVTTYYAIQKDMHDYELRMSDLNSKNGYNTRASGMNGKLPVGPICSPSIQSIIASIKPASSDYYFFVADKNGDTYLTKTNAEHNAIIKKLQAEGMWYTYDN